MPSYRWLAPPWHPHRRVTEMEPGREECHHIRLKATKLASGCMLVEIGGVGGRWWWEWDVSTPPPQKKKLKKINKLLKK